MSTALPDHKTLAELEEKFDPEMRFRPTVSPATQFVKWGLIALSLFHFYTAGFGLLRETTHRGVHLAFVLGLVFLVFAATRRSSDTISKHSWLTPGGVPIVDWLLALCAVVGLVADLLSVNRRLLEDIQLSGRLRDWREQ